METSWLAGGVALIGAGLCFWIWRARRAGGARDSASGYLIGDQIAGGTSSHHDHSHYDSGGDYGDSGGGDASGGA